MSKWRKRIFANWRAALAGAVVCTSLGWALLRWGNELILLGYDLPFFFMRGSPPKDVIIAYMDDISFAKLKQGGAEVWDREWHTRFVDRMTADGAKVVVFDVIFDVPRDAKKDSDFAQAIRRNGKVVLAAGKVEGRQLEEKAVVYRPVDIFLEAAAGWGIAAVYQSRVEDEIVRKYFVGDEFYPSLSWAAAKVAGAPITRRPNARQPDEYLHYYGLALRGMSYSEAFETDPGYFRDKVVFVGAMPKTLEPRKEADAFPTPYTRFTDKLSPGVEICATAFLNLWRNDGLREMPLVPQVVFVTAIGLFFGFFLSLLRPWAASGAAAVGAVLILAMVIYIAIHRVWFAWPIAVFVQIPVALAWSLRSLFFRLKFERDVATRTLEETTRLFESTKLTAQKPVQLVADHDLVRLVGKGAYGEVWLARNAIGAFHAVKIVRRAAFPSDVPYEREFRGVQKFMPISRSHAGFVNILHVGRNDAERCFYCIMEAGDDQTVGQKIDPETYTPKSLASELKWRGRITPEETLRLGLALTLALEHLHQNRLIHRDIKPGNIIYVNGHPKFADIGLVTDIAGEGKDVSFLGTQGYIPPEGPGSPGADVYALGKVLYEAAMGRDREFFPEVPTAVYEEPDDSLLRQLQKVIFKSCEASPTDRYQTAAQLHAALRDLEKQQNDRATKT